MCLRKVKHQKHNSALCWDDEKLSFLGGLSVFVSRREERGAGNEGRGQSVE